MAGTRPRPQHEQLEPGLVHAHLHGYIVIHIYIYIMYSSRISLYVPTHVSYSCYTIFIHVYVIEHVLTVLLHVHALFP